MWFAQAKIGNTREPPAPWSGAILARCAIGASGVSQRSNATAPWPVRDSEGELRVAGQAVTREVGQERLRPVYTTEDFRVRRGRRRGQGRKLTIRSCAGWN